MSMFFNEDDPNAPPQGGGAPAQAPAPKPAPAPAPAPDSVSGVVGYAKNLWDSAANSPAPLLGAINIPRQVAVDTGVSPPPPKATPGNAPGPNEHDKAIAAYALGQEDGAGDNSQSATSPFTKTPFVVAGTSSATAPVQYPLKGEEKDVDPSMRSATSNRIVDATKKAGEADQEIARQAAIGRGDEEGYKGKIAEATGESQGALQKNAKDFSDFMAKANEDRDKIMKMQVEDTPAQTFFKTIGNIMGTIGYSMMARSGRPELAAQMMDKALEREYRAQQDQKAEKGKKLGELQNSVDFFVKASGNERLGRLMWEDAAIRKYVKEAEAAAAKANTKIAWAAYERVKAGAELRLATTERMIQNAMPNWGRNQAGNLVGGGWDTNNPGKVGKIDQPAAAGDKGAKGPIKGVTHSDAQKSTKYYLFNTAMQEQTPESLAELGKVSPEAASYLTTVLSSDKQETPEQRKYLKQIQAQFEKTDKEEQAAYRKANGIPEPAATAVTTGAVQSSATAATAPAKAKATGVPPMLARDDTSAKPVVKRNAARTDPTPQERADIKNFKTKPDTFNIVNFTGTGRPFLIPKESDSPEVRTEIQTGGETKALLRAFAGAYGNYKNAANGSFGATDILRSNRDPKFTKAEAEFKGTSGLLLQKVAKLYDPKSAVRDADVEFAINHTGLMMQGDTDKLKSSFQNQEALDAATAQSIKTLSNFVDTKMSELRKSRGIVKGTRVVVKLDKNNNILEPTPEEMATMRSKDTNSIREYIRPDIADSTYSANSDPTTAGSK